MTRNKNPEKFLSKREREAVFAAISDAEERTSAEIKLILVRHCWDDITRKAKALFRKFKLYKTRERNAVLIMLVTTNKEFVIYGDRGIHEKVGDGFWQNTVAVMARKFKEDAFQEGLMDGISMIGEKLAVSFPRKPKDKNEVPNDVEFDNQ